MDFDLQWLLIGLPLAFALGWAASRLDLRQWRRDRRDAPRAYFEGLNLLLNEQQDKAIDAFIEAVQLDPDTTELHFALGNLFRRRGEFERAVRVHQHLLSRADLAPADRDRAQRALALDFDKAGLLDRAEAAWRALQDTRFETEARLALLALHERAHDWPAAIADAQALQAAGSGSFATRIAHYHCERAIEADAAGRDGEAAQALAAAMRAAPEAPRPLVLAGERAARAADAAGALAHWDRLRAVAPAIFPLVAEAYAQQALRAAAAAAAARTLRQAWDADPQPEMLPALEQLAEGGAADDADALDRLRLDHLERQPSLAAASAVLALPGERWRADTRQRLLQAVQRGARPLQRYRCAACGFEAQHYFWQCPGCQGWDTYPPRRLEAG
ncbi:MAG: lipopolysaccharide assembly protein LapB [Burkholderiales bacterium]|nr:lipopolysaccharide assembly protein LapB [Burkholderiales bacterium]